MSLKTTVGGLEFTSCIYNASGPRTGSIEALRKIGESKSGAILSKSSTLLSQTGNPMPRFINKIDLGCQFCQGSMNSEGLPNSGIDYYINADEIKSLRQYNKKYIVSLSGLKLEDNIEMLGRVLHCEDVDGIELNLACPNIPDKPIIAYDFDQIDLVLSEVQKYGYFNTSKPIGIKLAPYFDMSHVKKVIDIIVKYPIKYIVTINTIGNCLFVDYDKECSVIVPKGGFGGLGIYLI